MSSLRRGNRGAVLLKDAFSSTTANTRGKRVDYSPKIGTGLEGGHFCILCSGSFPKYIKNIPLLVNIRGKDEKEKEKKKKTGKSNKKDVPRFFLELFGPPRWAFDLLSPLIDPSIVNFHLIDLTLDVVVVATCPVSFGGFVVVPVAGGWWFWDHVLRVLRGIVVVEVGVVKC